MAALLQNLKLVDYSVTVCSNSRWVFFLQLNLQEYLRF